MAEMANEVRMARDTFYFYCSEMRKFQSIRLIFGSNSPKSDTISLILGPNSSRLELLKLFVNFLWKADTIIDVVQEKIVGNNSND